MSGDAPAELLPWDTAFFGFGIGRVRGPRLTHAGTAALAAWAQAHDVRCLYYLCGAADTESVRSAEADGYRLVDVRMVFEQSLPAPVPPAAPTVIRAWRPADVEALRRIAGGTFTGTRFHHDEGFPAERSRALYEEWVSRSCEGFADAVLVAELDAGVAGFVTCHLEAGRGRIGLVGVDASARGRQVGRQLVGAALRYFVDAGRTSAEVATQGRNVAAQRLYQRCGFLTASVHLWYHRWFTRR